MSLHVLFVELCSGCSARDRRTELLRKGLESGFWSLYSSVCIPAPSRVFTLLVRTLSLVSGSGSSSLFVAKVSL